MKIINSESKVRIYLLLILGLSSLYYILCIVVKNDFFQSVAFYDMDNTFMDWFNCVIGYRGNPYAGEVGTNYSVVIDMDGVAVLVALWLYGQTALKLRLT